MQHITDDTKFVDPDPFVVAATCLAAAGVALQFIQTFNLHERKISDQPYASETSYSPLKRIQEAIDEILSNITKIEKAIDDGSNEPDNEFHKVAFGVNLGFLTLKYSVHSEYSRKLSDLIQHFGAFSTWANHLIHRDPDVAAVLGEEMIKTVSGADERLNKLIRCGAANEQILAESRLILKACYDAAEALLRKKN